MSENNVNPLDINLDDIKTTMPNLAPGVYDMRVAKSSIEDGKNNPSAKMWNLDLVTTAPAQAEDGSTLGAGIHVFHRVNLVKVGKLTLQQIVQELAKVKQGFAIQWPHFSEANLLATVTQMHKQYEGQVARVRVIVTKPQERNGKTYAPKNEVSMFVKPA